MENIIIGTVVSLVVFIAFFGVFWLRGRANTNKEGIHGCGQPTGQCRCRQPASAIQSIPPPEPVVGCTHCQNALPGIETPKDVSK